MTEMMELMEKEFERAIMNMFKNLKENLKITRRYIEGIKRK